MAIPDLSHMALVLWYCVLIWFYIYTLWLYLPELTFCALPIAFFATILFIMIHVLRVAPPDHKVVDQVLGYDPWYVDKNLIKQSNGYFMDCCAHRGAGLDAPENSLSAFRRCKEKGCTAVEFDVVLTKDLVPIIFHDVNVHRLCDVPGVVKDMTWDELKDLDISVKHPLHERYSGEKIALFDEAIEVCLDLGLRMFIDVKGDDDETISVILNAFKKHGELYTRALVSSFNPIFIYKVRRADPLIVGSLAWRPQFFTYFSFSGINGGEGPRYSNPFKHFAAQVVDTVHTWALNHLTYYIIGLSTVLVFHIEVTARLSRHWHHRGVRPIAWSVNSSIEKEYFKNILRVTYLTDTLET